MKRIINILQGKASKMVLLAITACTIASCDSILDFEEGDCSVEYRVRFKYDYNMKKADAFASEVKAVSIYAFDDEGRFVYQRTEEGEKLKEDDYSMKVDIDPSQYHLVVWAGLTDQQSFAVPLLVEGDEIDNLTVKAERTITGTRADGEKESIIRRNLAPLFHGEIAKASMTRAGTTNIMTIPLVKNTNSLRIVLQQMNGVTMTKDDFDFSIYDDNGWMNYDNSLLKDDELTYKPYNMKAGSTTNTAKNRTATDSENTNITFVTVDLTVARLMLDKNPTLRITNNKTKEKVLQIPLIQYLLLSQPFEAEGMDKQEYLDRQDNYSMTFFLDPNLSWINSKIIINEWIIHNNVTDL